MAGAAVAGGVTALSCSVLSFSRVTPQRAEACTLAVRHANALGMRMQSALSRHDPWFGLKGQLFIIGECILQIGSERSSDGTSRSGTTTINHSGSCILAGASIL